MVAVALLVHIMQILVRTLLRLIILDNIDTNSFQPELISKVYGTVSNLFISLVVLLHRCNENCLEDICFGILLDYSHAD